MTSARTRRYGRERAAVDPIARLMVDVALPHLDRPFDYAVSTELDDAVSAGSRVRVRFSGRLVDAFVLERRDSTDHEGTLAFVERSVGAQPVLNPETARLFRAVADRYAGNFVDVVRLGVPPRHARAESAERRLAELGSRASGAGSGPVGALPSGPVLHRSRAGRPPGPGRLDITCRRAMGSATGRGGARRTGSRSGGGHRRP